MNQTITRLWQAGEPALVIILLIYRADPNLPAVLDRGFVLLYYLFLAIVMVRYWKPILYYLLQNLPLLLLLLLPLASVFWSTVPNTSLTLFYRTALRAMIFGSYLAIRYNSNQIMRLIVWVMGLSIFFSTFASLTPYGRAGGGQWRGIFFHKNYLARMMSWSGVTFAAFAIYTEKYRNWSLFGLLMSVAIILLARGQSSTAIFFATLVFLPLYKFLIQTYRLRTVLLILSIIGGAISIIVVINSIEYIIVDLLGKDLTLTGRTTIWDYYMSRAMTRPLLGFGYEGYWRNAEEVLRAKIALPWFSGHAHSGYIDFFLQLGTVGTAMFALCSLILMLRVIWLIVLTRSIEYFQMFLFLVITFASNYSVSITILKDHLFWIMYIAIYISTSIELKQIQEGHYKGKVYAQKI